MTSFVETMLNDLTRKVMAMSEHRLRGWTGVIRGDMNPGKRAMW